MNTISTDNFKSLNSNLINKQYEKSNLINEQSNLINEQYEKSNLINKQYEESNLINKQYEKSNLINEKSINEHSSNLTNNDISYTDMEKALYELIFNYIFIDADQLGPKAVISFALGVTFAPIGRGFFYIILFCIILEFIYALIVRKITLKYVGIRLTLLFTYILGYILGRTIIGDYRSYRGKYKTKYDNMGMSKYFERREHDSKTRKRNKPGLLNKVIQSSHQNKQFKKQKNNYNNKNRKFYSEKKSIKNIII